MNEMNIDYWKVAEQAMDMAIDNELLKIAKESDPYMVKILQLLTKYGIYGVKAIAFMNEFNNITKEISDNADNK